MSLLIIGDIDHVQDAPATIESVTSEATGHDADLTLTRRRSETWRSTGVSGTERVAWDLGASRDIDVVAALTNGLPGGTIALDVGDDNTWATTEYDASETIVPAGTPAGRGSVRRTVPWVHTLPTTNSRYVRLSLTDTDHSDGYHELEVVMIGQALTLPGVRDGWSPVLQTAGPQYERRRYEVSLRALTLTQKGHLEDLLAALGTDGRMIIVPSTLRTVARPREALYCRVLPGSDVQWGSQLGGDGTGDLWQVDLRVEEVLD